MRRYIFLFLLPLLLFAAGKRLSPLPLPKTYFLNLDTYPCDRYCLQDHLSRGEIFSFLAKLPPKLAPYFKDELAKIPFIEPIVSKERIKLTLITPSKKLSPLLSKSSKAIALYLLQKGQPFELTTVIDPELQNAIDQAQESDLILLLLPFAQRGLLTTLQSNTKLFVPTINRRFVKEPQNFLYGGIDYLVQIDKLLKYNRNSLSIFSSPHIELLNILTQYAATKSQQTSIIEVKNRASNLKWQIKQRKSLRYNNILLNTPIVTTSLVLSQLTLYNYNPPHKFSTQINLSPKIFNFTQEKDRQNLLIANSIYFISPQSEAAISLAKTNLFYDWISYACIVALDNIFLDRSMHETFRNRQIDYEVELWQYKAMGFERKFQENSRGF